LGADGATVAIKYTDKAGAASTMVEAIEPDGGKTIAIRADPGRPVSAGARQTVA
jgi:hypothetical protein